MLSQDSLIHPVEIPTTYKIIAPAQPLFPPWLSYCHVCLHVPQNISSLFKIELVIFVPLSSLPCSLSQKMMPPIYSSQKPEKSFWGSLLFSPFHLQTLTQCCAFYLLNIAPISSLSPSLLLKMEPKLLISPDQYFFNILWNRCCMELLHGFVIGSWAPNMRTSTCKVLLMVETVTNNWRPENPSRY